MRRWDPLNPRQLAVLKRISTGEDLSRPDDVPERYSAHALRNRGLVSISKGGGTWRAVITEVSQFYLEHGYHPDHPDRAPTAEAGSLGVEFEVGIEFDTQTPGQERRQAALRAVVRRLNA